MHAKEDHCSWLRARLRSISSLLDPGGETPRAPPALVLPSLLQPDLAHLGPPPHPSPPVSRSRWPTRSAPETSADGLTPLTLHKTTCHQTGPRWLWPSIVGAAGCPGDYSTASLGPEPARHRLGLASPAPDGGVPTMPRDGLSKLSSPPRPRPRLACLSLLETLRSWPSRVYQCCLHANGAALHAGKPRPIVICGAIGCLPPLRPPCYALVTGRSHSYNMLVSCSLRRLSLLVVLFPDKRVHRCFLLRQHGLGHS